MVSSPITVAGLTWNPVSAYTPVAMTRSWIKATKAAMAIFQSKAIVRYSTITIRNAMSASTALVVIWLPQLDPTNWTLILLALTPRWLTSEFSTVLVCVLLSVGVCTCQDLPREPLSSCTMAPLTPASVTAPWTWATDADGAARGARGGGVGARRSPSRVAGLPRPGAREPEDRRGGGPPGRAGPRRE